MSDTITPEQRAKFARDARVVRANVPSGYLVAHRTADAVTALLAALSEQDDARLAVERVEALADEWSRNDSRTWVSSLADDLRAALAGGQ